MLRRLIITNHHGARSKLARVRVKAGYRMVVEGAEDALRQKELPEADRRKN
jgi:hypothetical protein